MKIRQIAPGYYWIVCDQTELEILYEASLFGLVDRDKANEISTKIESVMEEGWR